MKIAFGHNVYNREKTLLETINNEKKYFPNSIFYVAYNGNIDKKKFNIKDVFFTKFIPETHKAGCVNGFLTSIKSSLNDNNFDIFIFSHDDISISNIKIFRRNINYIINDGYDAVVRMPINISKTYFMMETVFLSPRLLKMISKESLINSDNDIVKDHRNSPSPEVYLYNLLTKYTNNIKIIEYIHDSINYNNVLNITLGVYHKMAGKRGWND